MQLVSDLHPQVQRQLHFLNNNRTKRHWLHQGILWRIWRFCTTAADRNRRERYDPKGSPSFAQDLRLQLTVRQPRHHIWILRPNPISVLQYGRQPKRLASLHIWANRWNHNRIPQVQRSGARCRRKRCQGAFQTQRPLSWSLAGHCRNFEFQNRGSSFRTSYDELAHRWRLIASHN